MDATSQTIPGEEVEEPATSKPWLVSLFDLIRQQPLGAAGAIIVIIMVFLAIFAEFVAPFDPVVNNFGSMHIPPDGTHWFGTDQFGRDPKLLTTGSKGATNSANMAKNTIMITMMAPAAPSGCCRIKSNKETSHGLLVAGSSTSSPGMV
jgi:ABC-type dipeptide/oligopeptide/nickel transport system permease subunit